MSLIKAIFFNATIEIIVNAALRQAKGLEYNIVLLSGVSEKCIPYQKLLDGKGGYMNS